MAHKFRLTVTGTVMILLLSLGLTACGSNSNDGGSASTNNDNGNDQGDDDVELGDKDITIPYVAWAGVEARTHLLAQVLRDVGYNVELKEVEAGPMYSSVADGSADFVTCLWLPATHGEYWDKYEDDLTKVNEVLDQAPLSLTVPEYMDIDSIEDLKDNEELGEATDWKLIGIDPGAGIMNSTEKAMDEYGLDNWDLQSSSEAAMLSMLGKAYDNEDPIIITGWKPHWMFAEWDLKMLDDSEEIYGGEGDQIYIAARNDFEDDSPAAYQILDQYTEDYDQLNDLMGKIHGGDDPEDVAKQFIKDNPDKIDEWEKGVASE